MTLRRLLILGAMLLAAGLVHLVYIGQIRPAASLTIDNATQAKAAVPRTFVVVLKDAEQEVCIILALCALVLIGEKLWRLHAQDYLFDVDLFEPDDPDENESLDLASLEETAQDIPDSPLLETLMASLRRYHATDDLQNASDVVQTKIDSTGMKLEAGNAAIRYMIWAIPSIGFVGTVRGISQALSEADKALAGDIASMTAALGTAFNSTFVALLLSIVLMALLSLLQKAQDSTVIKIEKYCDQYLVRRLGSIASTGSA